MSDTLDKTSHSTTDKALHSSSHKWRFFTAGAFAQPLLRNAKDLAALADLDQKLWATLACPTERLNLNAKFLSLLDVNNDGRLRVPEVLAAVNWSLERLTDPDCLFSQRPLNLQDFKNTPENHNLISAALRLHELLARPHEEGLSAEDTASPQVIFPANKPNGDGLVPPELAPTAELEQQINLILSCLEGQQDRSGQLGLSAENLQEFYAQVRQVQAWHQSASSSTKQPFGAQTASILPLIQQLKNKIDDYFTRAHLLSYDSRAAAAMAASDADLSRLSAGDLSQLEDLSALPLANLEQGLEISFTQGLNPAWQEPMQQLYQQLIQPEWGELNSLSFKLWQEILARVAAYFAWQKQQPQVSILQQLPLEEILHLDASRLETELLKLVDLDLEVAAAAQGWVDLDKLLNMQAYLVPLLYNFVSFEDFYSRKNLAIFQAGRLYIDGKSCDLVVDVADIEQHSTIAVQSNCYLIYCHCTRRLSEEQPLAERKIVALVSAGSEHELMLGRNGLFYDRQGQDWDATLVKVIDNPISIRQAFFSPYKRLADLISTQIQKLAAIQDAHLMLKAETNLNTASTSKTPATLVPFDIAKFAGVFAALGLALGALSTAFIAAFSSLATLESWQLPLVFLGLMLVVSGPSMLLAWFKLRKRSLGPILDANGWAVNAQARIDIPFGTSLTHLAHLPAGASKSKNSLVKSN